MIFGKIEYLNLLPFHVFMKKYTKSSREKMIMHHKKGVPSHINKEFLSKRVDSAFISSIKAKKYNHVDLGIIADKKVLSVLVLPNSKSIKDKESATSNILANILDIKGKVLIGDKALKYYLNHEDYIDLVEIWHQKHHLPFVFALLCYHQNKKVYKKIEKEFLKRKVKIPQYLLTKASKNTKIDKKNILKYLTYISYNLNKKAKKGLKKFYLEVEKSKLKP